MGTEVRTSRVWAVATLLALSWPGTTSAQVTPSMTLTERWSVPWPNEARISRIILHQGGEIVIQAGPSVYLLRDSLPLEPVGNFELLDIVGLTVTAEGLELADRRSGRLIRTDMAGRVKIWTRIPGLNRGDMLSGVSTPCGWVIGMARNHDDAGGSYELQVLDSVGGAPSRRVQVPFPPTHMTSTGARVVISESTAPHRVATLTCDADRVVEISTAAVQRGLDLEAWHPLAAFCVRTRILQTWVDTRSDRRRFALFGDNGSLLRQTDLTAPLTLVAGTGEGLVVGLRTIPDLEVVVFDSHVGPGSVGRSNQSAHPGDSTHPVRRINLLR